MTISPSLAAIQTVRRHSLVHKLYMHTWFLPVLRILADWTHRSFDFEQNSEFVTLS